MTTLGREKVVLISGGMISVVMLGGVICGLKLNSGPKESVHTN